MDASSANIDSDSLDWSTDDELEVHNTSPPFLGQQTFISCGEASSSKSKLIQQFVNMGFSEWLVLKAIEENGEDEEASILDSLLTYSALEKSPPICQQIFTEPCPFESERNIADDLSDGDSCPGIEGNANELLMKDKILSLLVDMGYSVEEALMAMDNCGPDAQMTELTDYICAAQMENELDAQVRESPDEVEVALCSRPRPRNDCPPSKKKRKLHEEDRWNPTSRRGRQENQVYENEEIINLPKLMEGFGVPDKPWPVVERLLPEAAAAPPYFYYENVALTPKGVWGKMSRFLYDIKPEFVDSLHFSAAARKRGYIHNLPIHNRSPLLPRPPQTIQEAFPLTKKWRPPWDKRTKFNCIQTTIGNRKLTEGIRKALEKYNGNPPPKVQKYILEQCRRWNLVWVGRNRVAPLEPDELEMLLGYPRDHTRGGTSRTERYKALGNSFQVDTVAYHLSVLKDQFPNGINVLSLFSGIGGAEVALDRLEIPLKNVVSVELLEVNRSILRSWWNQTNQLGNLIEVADVQKVTAGELQEWIIQFGGFDLVIGGSPCNNLSGNNRATRDGLEGEHSSLFYEYCRILDLVKALMAYTMD